MNESVIIARLFNDVYGVRFNKNQFEHRFKLQKLCYFMQEAGALCGDYGFMLYKHGPYSHKLFALSPEITKVKTVDSKALELTEYAQGLIRSLINIISHPHDGYTDVEWLEAVMTLHYIFRYGDSTITDERAAELVEGKKPHLNIKSLNLAAAGIARAYYAKFK